MSFGYLHCRATNAQAFYANDRHDDQVLNIQGTNMIITAISNKIHHRFSKTKIHIAQLPDNLQLICLVLP